VVTGPVVQEVQQTFSEWLTQTIRLVNGSDYVHLETTIGPIPIADGLGKEVVARYATGLHTGQYFYTDTNGLEMLQRKTDFRPTWPLNITEPIAENYYPMNSAAYIEDTSADSRLTLLSDRSHGAASIIDGELEVMMQRRLLHDDYRGVGEPLNESAPIRLHDFVVVDAASRSSAHQRTLAQYASFPPLLYFSPVASPSDWIKNYQTSFSPLQAPLPANVRLETFKTRTDGSVLVRLAHVFAVGEDPILSQNATVDLTNLFVHRIPTELTELTLSANQPLAELHRLSWNIQNEPLPTSDPEVVPVTDFVITLSAMDIRTFNVRFQDAK